MTETSPAKLVQPPLPSVPEHGWAPGPDPARWTVCPPLLGAGAVHVWRADLTAVEEEVCALLCSEERARAERMSDERARELWMRSRGVLRALLGGYLQRDPATLRFTANAHGKPALLDDATVQTQPMSFNLSHSAGLGLYAFSSAAAVGVDVELARRPIDAVAIARRAFGAAEAERLAGLDPEVREQEFLRAWVRHEAELKFLGAGIGAGACAVGGRAGWIAELDIGPRAAAAVAGGTRPSELRCWAWS